MRPVRAFDTEELIERASRGDSSAAEALLAGHRERLRRMIAARLDRRLATRADASDVVQESLVAAARDLPAYLQARPLPLAAWLWQFASERIAKLRRFHIGTKRRTVSREECVAPRFGSESMTNLVERLAASGTSPSQHVIRDEERRSVTDALKRLPSSDREVLILRNVDQLAMAEIAASLGITEGAAKVRHLRALRRLRAELETRQ